MVQDAKLDWYREVNASQPEYLSVYRARYYFAKRFLDLVLTITALIILAPLMILISLLIRFDSPGPSLFRQPRMGAKRQYKGEKLIWEPVEFSCLKFRTMVNNADPSQHINFMKAFIHPNQKVNTFNSQDGNPTLKLVNDRRITRFGKILRKTSLDELPQLWNILTGEMSLVGPRPAILYELDDYESWHFQRLQATPGLSGLWQVTARSCVEFDEMVKLDLEYIQNQSLWLDIKIILKTPIVVLSGKGAH